MMVKSVPATKPSATKKRVRSPSPADVFRLTSTAGGVDDESIVKFTVLDGQKTPTGTTQLRVGTISRAVDKLSKSGQIGVWVCVQSTTRCRVGQPNLYTASVQVVALSGGKFQQLTFTNHPHSTQTVTMMEVTADVAPYLYTVLEALDLNFNTGGVAVTPSDELVSAIEHAWSINQKRVDMRAAKREAKAVLKHAIRAQAPAAKYAMAPRKKALTAALSAVQYRLKWAMAVNEGDKAILHVRSRYDEITHSLEGLVVMLDCLVKDSGGLPTPAGAGSATASESGDEDEDADLLWATPSTFASDSEDDADTA